MPVSRMASASSVVPIGRLMKWAEMVIGAPYGAARRSPHGGASAFAAAGRRSSGPRTPRRRRGRRVRVRRCGLDDTGAGLELVLAVDDDALAGGQTLVDDRQA